MNTMVDMLVTATVFYFMWKVIGPTISFSKRRTRNASIKREGYKPKDPVLAEISRLRSQERRLRSELRRVQAEIKETATS